MINIETCPFRNAAVIKKSWMKKEGCPATESNSLPPENKVLEASDSRLKGEIIIVT